MKALLTLFYLCLTLNSLAKETAIKELTKEEVITIQTEIKKMMDTFNNGDASLIIEKTHPSLIKLMGGKEKFTTITKGAVKFMKDQNIVFEENSIGKPGQIFPAGDEEVSFVPRISVMNVNGKRIKSTNFMIAIRSKGTTEWNYLDGAGLRKNTEMLWQLLPKLTRDLEMPATKTEILPKKAE